MKKRPAMKCLVALFSSLSLLVTQADAKPGKGKGNGASHSQKQNKSKGPEQTGKGDKKTKGVQFARFKDSERAEIVGYFGRYQNQKGNLPPGLAKNMRRGKPLPPGWQKKLVPGYRIDDVSWLSFAPVPSEWFPNLRMEPDTRLYHHEDRVVRVYEPRREVIEVIVLPSPR